MTRLKDVASWKADEMELKVEEEEEGKEVDEEEQEPEEPDMSNDHGDRKKNQHWLSLHIALTPPLIWIPIHDGRYFFTNYVADDVFWHYSW